MADSVRMLETGLRPARWNVAMTAALVATHVAGASTDLVRFYRYPTSILLGRNQQADLAADLDYCRRNRIEIARRVTGGGAVFMTEQMLAWEVIVDRQRWGDSLPALTARLCAGVATGLARLGLAAVFTPPGEISVRGRKISGTAGYSEGRSAVLQGTILVGDDTMAMSSALRIPAGELASRMTCLANEIASPPSVARLADTLLQGLLAESPASPRMDQPTPAEHELCETLLCDEIGTDTFVFGSAPCPTSS